MYYTTSTISATATTTTTTATTTTILLGGIRGTVVARWTACWPTGRAIDLRQVHDS